VKADVPGGVLARLLGATGRPAPCGTGSPPRRRPPSATCAPSRTPRLFGSGHDRALGAGGSRRETGFSRSRA
jgi:hypothetical protein